MWTLLRENKAPLTQRHGESAHLVELFEGAIEVAADRSTVPSWRLTLCFLHAPVQEAQALPNELFWIRTEVPENATRETESGRPGVVSFQHQP